MSPAQLHVLPQAATAESAQELADSAELRVEQVAAALRALRDLTGGEHIEVARQHLNEVKRDDLASLIGLIEESARLAVTQLTQARRLSLAK